MGQKELNDIEIKYIAVEDWPINNLDIELGLTATSWWQAYNTEISSAFRENQYKSRASS